MGLPKEIRTINEWLERVYGCDLLRRPYYRLAFTTGQVEKRKGLFADYYGPIITREFYGVREQGKYEHHPYWRDRWVLERLSFDENPELALDTAGHYEPLYVFYDEKGEYQRPNMHAVQFFMTKLLMKKPWKTQEEREKEWDETDKKEFQEEVNFFYGCLEDTFGGSLAAAIRQKEGVVNPGVLYTADGETVWFDRGFNGTSDSSVDSALPVQGPEARSVPGGIQDSGVHGRASTSAR